MIVTVKNGNINQAIKLLSKMLNKDGMFKTLRDKEAYTPPSKKALKKHKLAVSRIKKLQRKKLEQFENQESRLTYRTGYGKKVK